MFLLLLRLAPLTVPTCFQTIQLRPCPGQHTQLKLAVEEAAGPLPGPPAALPAGNARYPYDPKVEGHKRPQPHRVGTHRGDQTTGGGGFTIIQPQSPSSSRMGLLRRFRLVPIIPKGTLSSEKNCSAPESGLCHAPLSRKKMKAPPQTKHEARPS